MAAPSSASAIMPRTCSRMNMIKAITPTARKPGISRTLCSKPISAPSNCATSITKLFNSAAQVAKAIGIAAAIMNKRVIGRRQRGRLIAAEIGSVWTILQDIGAKPRCGEGKRSGHGRKNRSSSRTYDICARYGSPGGTGSCSLWFSKWRLTWPFKSKPFQ